MIPLVWLMGLVYSCFSLNLNLALSQVQSNSQWTRVQLKAEGGMQPYIFSYTQLPVGWRQIRNYIYLPNKALQFQAKYLCRLIVRDKNFDQLQASIVFLTSSNKLYLLNNVYPFDYQLPQESLSVAKQSEPLNMRKTDQANGQQDPPQDKLEMESKQMSDSMEFIQNDGQAKENIEKMTLPNDQTNIDLPKRVQRADETLSETRQIESIFTRFPSPTQLDEIIFKTDVFSMSKTIQLVIASEDLNCEQKIAYLSDFLGRINSAIKMKRFTLAQLKIIIESAATQIERLQTEIRLNQDTIFALDLQSLQSQLIIQLNVLEEMYDQFNENDIQIKPQEQKLNQTHEKIMFLEVAAEKNREQIKTKQIQLQNAQNEVKKIQALLRQAQKKRNAVELSLNSSKKGLEEINSQITTEEQNIVIIEQRIKQLQDKSYQLKQKYAEQEIVTERIRLNVNQALNKQNILFDEISNLERRIYEENDKLVLRQRQILTKMVQSLQRSLPNIQQDIDRIYYACFDTLDIETKRSKGILIYEFNEQIFFNYVQNAYGISPPQPYEKTVNLTTSNILQDIWSTTFGAAFNESAVVNPNYFIFPTDFNCLNPSSLEFGFGTIVKIEKNLISVDRNGEIVKLKLGACSRIESITPLPEPGRTLYWKANDVGNQTYEVYTALCF